MCWKVKCNKHDRALSEFEFTHIPSGVSVCVCVCDGSVCPGLLKLGLRSTFTHISEQLQRFVELVNM